jgi:uncharacterized protein YneR
VRFVRMFQSEGVSYFVKHGDGQIVAVVTGKDDGVKREKREYQTRQTQIYGDTVFV